VAVTVANGGLVATDGLSSDTQVSGDQLRVVFRDGQAFHIENLSQIRSRLLSNLEI
jgi:hypothetical protein